MNDMALKRLRPLNSFNEYLSRRWGADSAVAAYIANRAKANHLVVEAFDKVVADFNADLERIKAEDDKEAVLKFSREAFRLIRGIEADF